MKTLLRISLISACAILSAAIFPFISTASPMPEVGMLIETTGDYLQANNKLTVPIHIKLNGFILEDQGARAPINVAIVLDRSSSMSGDKIVKAKEAAIMAVESLSSKDIISIVTYDSNVEIVVPATRLTDKHSVIQKIQQISPRGSTALYAGVSKGAREIRKFLNSEQVNRVVLLSDGLANVGPSSPFELGSLGQTLAKDGMAVSTIGLGLGYNEDLMTQLADRSDGNHAFVENTNDLVRVFNTEFGELTKVVAQDIEIIIDCLPGVRPIRVLGRDAEIAGSKVITHMGHLYSGQDKSLVIEVEISPNVDVSRKQLAFATAKYTNLASKQEQSVSRNLAVGFSNKQKLLQANSNKEAITSYYTLLANENNLKVIALRDEGKIEEAQSISISNSQLLGKAGKDYEIEELAVQSKAYEVQSKHLKSKSWGRMRKGIAEQNYRMNKSGRFHDNSVSSPK